MYMSTVYTYKWTSMGKGPILMQFLWIKYRIAAPERETIFNHPWFSRSKLTDCHVIGFLRKYLFHTKLTISVKIELSKVFTSIYKNCIRSYTVRTVVMVNHTVRDTAHIYKHINILIFFYQFMYTSTWWRHIRLPWTQRRT